LYAVLAAACFAGATGSVVQAQSPLLVRADSAFAADDVALARRLYQDVLRADPGQSRAVFRLAQLEPRAERALALLQQYCQLEPADVWGRLALSDQLARMGRIREALIANDSAAALAPDERDVAMGRARIFQRAGQRKQSLHVLAGWTDGHSEDGEAWDQLGREQVRAGRPRAAIRSFARADSLGSIPGASARLRAARSAAAPVFEPFGNYQRDSDGNTVRVAGLRGDVLVADGARVGFGARRGEVGDDTLTTQSTSVHATMRLRPDPAVRLDIDGNVRRFDDPMGVRWTHPEIDARLRLRGSARGSALEVRGQHLTLGASPLLVLNQVTRTEARATLDLPLGALRLRPGGRFGVVEASIPEVLSGVPLPPSGPRSPGVRRNAERNTRAGVDAVLAWPVTTAFEWSAQYHRLSYERPSAAGYFAPRIAETIESGIYAELGTDGPVTLAADVGGGVQRMAPHGAAAGEWAAAFRLWSALDVPFRPGRSLWAEVEAYDALFAPTSVATSTSWRFLSLSLGLRWSVR
jgi:hypothetical protein